jgi:hypothetical protein
MRGRLRLPFTRGIVGIHFEKIHDDKALVERHMVGVELEMVSVLNFHLLLK